MGSDSGNDKSGKSENLVDPNNPKSGQYDPTRGRTLGYNDFVGGGMYGPDNARGEDPGKPDWQARRDTWNSKAKTTVDGHKEISEVSDYAVLRDRAKKGVARALRDANSNRDQAKTSGARETLGDSVGPLGLNAGPDVAKTQQALKDEGFALEVTGDIDTPTVNATKMVQEEKGLKVDGQINPGGPTEKALFGDGGLKSLTPDITQKHPGTVSTAQQVANLERQAKAADDAQKQAQRAEQQRQREADAQRKSRQTFHTIDEQVTQAYRASQQQKQQQQEKAKTDEALRKARQEFREIDQHVMESARKIGLLARSKQTKQVSPTTEQTGYGLSPVEEKMVQVGDVSGFWNSRKAKGDPIADIALKSLNPPGGFFDALFGGRSVNDRLEAFARVYTGKSVDLEKVRKDFMREHAQAVQNDNKGKPGLLDPGQVYDYHQKVFSGYGLPSTAFGGSPFTGHKMESHLTRGLWCSDCDE